MILFDNLVTVLPIHYKTANLECYMNSITICIASFFELRSD